MLVLIYVLVCGNGCTATVSSTERSALVDVYDSMNGQSGGLGLLWPLLDLPLLSSDPCDNNWSGVTCNAAGTHVM